MNNTMQMLVVAWALTATAIVVDRWRQGRGMGLVVAYVAGLSSLHALAATLYVLPWFEGLDRDDVSTGLRIALLGLLSFGVGATVQSRASRRPVEHVEPPAPELARGPSLGLLYVISGAALYTVVIAGLRAIPSVGGVASAGSSLAVFGLCLLLWQASRGRRVLWLSLTLLLPVATILAQGYLSYGIAALVTVVAFVAERQRPRWMLVVAGLLLAYVTMSFYVTYMRDRREIRDAVWYGADASARVSLLANTIVTIEPFNPLNETHLSRVDDRLNQNYLVGRAVSWIGNGFATFGRGSTLEDAALALIPRAAWPDKPVSAGSGNLVSQFTGMQFDPNTSVGIGQVMELYVNFGIAGVVVGFLVIGVVVSWIDTRAGAALERDDARRACLWFLPGLSLLQVGGSFVDITATAAAGLAAAWIVNLTIDTLVRAGVLRAPDRWTT